MRSPVLALTLALVINGAAGASNLFPVRLVLHVAGDEPSISGTTNLPDGFGISVDIWSSDARHVAGAVTEIQAGRFSVGPFSVEGAPFLPGLYWVHITSPIDELQPAGVQAILGEHGQYMRGPVRPNSFDPEDLTVDLSQFFIVQESATR